MHDASFADVVGKKPAILLFATPALCQSRVCGPVVDIAEQVKAERGDEAAFIHQEIFKDNDADKGFRPQVLSGKACQPSPGCSPSTARGRWPPARGRLQRGELESRGGRGGQGRSRRASGVRGPVASAATGPVAQLVRAADS